MKVIGNIQPLPILEYKKLALVDANLAGTELGGISSEYVEKKACELLYSLLKAEGYRTRESAWREPSLNAIKGSVAPHEDDGLGLVAFWLLHKQPFDRKREDKGMWWAVDDPWLFTSRQSRLIKVGDVVVFDASKPHWWMCNGGTYAISQTISRKRKR